MKPVNHVTNLKCFNQVAAVIGPAKAQIELFRVVNYGEEVIFSDAEDVFDSFVWRNTPQGSDFWRNIDRGETPYV